LHEISAKQEAFKERSYTVKAAKFNPIPDEGYNASPAYTSVKQRASIALKNARTKVGLTEETE